MSQSSACSQCGKPLSPSLSASAALCPHCQANQPAQPTATFRSPNRATPSKQASPPPTVDPVTFLKGLRDIQLIPEELLVQHTAHKINDVNHLASALISARLLTEYQARAVLQGKAKGLLIGSYLVSDMLGVGGMGVVYKARHRSSGRIVALKILPPAFSHDTDAVSRFRREFLLASRLNHPNLVAAIEANENRGVHYLTMEYIPGHDLDRLVNSGGPMSVKLALHCATQVARALEAAHAQGVIHRDVKPGNIMIDPTGAVRVLDLGLARVMESQAGFGANATATLTQPGAYLGTIDYLAPEQANDARTADHRADIYSLGCTLYFMLTGKPPFPADTVLKRLIAHQERPAPSLAAARPEIGERLDRVYLRMMSKRPDDRPHTMSELILDLEACRSSVREAGDASIDLKTFAKIALKRASDRKKRGPDASVFAQSKPNALGLSFDPDLNLEDLVGDYREEVKRTPLKDDELPPLVSQPLPRRVIRKRSYPHVAWYLVGLIWLCVLGVFLLRLRDSESGDVAHQEQAPSELALLENESKGKRLSNDDDSDSRSMTLASSAANGSELNAAQNQTAGPSPADSNLLFSDDYGKPQSYWSATTPEQLSKNPSHRWGHRESLYFDEVTTGSALYFGGMPNRQFDDFSCEVVGRVVGNNPSSKGSMMVRLIKDGQGFLVRIDGAGGLFLEPVSNRGAPLPGGPWIGPIFHPMIKQGGGDYNNLRLRVGGKRVEVWVNEVLVCPPLLFDQEMTPATLALGVICEVPAVRAEYDSVKVTRWKPPRPEVDAAAVADQKPIRIRSGGGAVMADGTWVFEGSALPIVEKTGQASAYTQDRMNDFPGSLWSNQRHLFWNSPRIGDTLSLSIPIEEDGSYEVFGRFTRAVDYGRARLELNGTPLIEGNFIDLFNPVVDATNFLPLGFVSIQQGKAILKISIVGKSRAATKYCFGLDELRLVPVR